MAMSSKTATAPGTSGGDDADDSDSGVVNDMGDYIGVDNSDDHIDHGGGIMHAAWSNRRWRLRLPWG